MKVIKFILWVILFIYLCILFLPKTNLFYLAEGYIKKQNIVLNETKSKDFLGTFSLIDTEVFFDNLNIAKVKDISIYPYFFYNQVSINDAKLSIKQFVPSDVENITAKYSIFYPHYIFLSSHGEFGNISGGIDLFKRFVKLKLQPKKDFLVKYPLVAKEFKKQKSEYVYERNF